MLALATRMTAHAAAFGRIRAQVAGQRRQRPPRRGLVQPLRPAQKAVGAQPPQHQIGVADGGPAGRETAVERRPPRLVIGMISRRAGVGSRAARPHPQPRRPRRHGPDCCRPRRRCGCR